MPHLKRPYRVHLLARPRAWLVGLVLVILLGMALPGLAADSLVYSGTLDLATKPAVDYGLVFGAGSAISVTLDCFPNVFDNPLDPAVQITGPNGFVAFDDDSGLVMCTYGGSAELTFIAPSEGLYTIRVASAYYFGKSVVASHASGGYRLTVQIEGTYAIPSAPGAPWNPGDDRLNGTARDMAAPVAIYSDPLQIYVIDPATGHGLLVLSISTDQIDAVGVPVGANATLGETVNPYSGQPILVSRLTTGEFQVNTVDGAGNPYIVIWDLAGNVYYPPG